jgi:M6 family metalloprotease-like protein
MRTWAVVHALMACGIWGCSAASDDGPKGAAAGQSNGGGGSSGASAGASASAGRAGAGNAGAGVGGVSMSGAGGQSGSAAMAGASQWEWPTYEQAALAPKSTRVLVVLLDFSNTEISQLLAQPEAGWSELVFGTKQGQGNHFWYQTSGGQFQLLKAAETGGVANNGVISVKLSTPQPVDGTFVVQAQTWIPEALDLAKAAVDFPSFDKNGDGILQNNELSVLFVLNLPFSRINGAGAEANVPINHPIAGTNVTLEKFTRVEDDYTSIGVPMHELGHHILGLKHGPAPSTHDLMGLGSYGEDPVLTTLHNSMSHYATRPTGLHGLNKLAAGFVEPTHITETTRGLKLYAPETGKAYNVLELPVVDGFLYLENRTAWGYDQSIPFCNGDQGGLFPIDASQYLSPLDIPGISKYPPLESFDLPEDVFCDFYAFSGHNAGFSLGAWTIENVSAPGPVMTLDLVKKEVSPKIAHYKFRYWILNPNKEGYRMWHRAEATQNGNTSIDFATFPFGDDPTAYFTISLESYYDTGEVRSVNADSTWTSESPYVSLNTVSEFTNPGAFRKDRIIQIALNPAATHVSSAKVNVSSGSFQTSFTLNNIPQ